MSGIFTSDESLPALRKPLRNPFNLQFNFPNLECCPEYISRFPMKALALPRNSQMPNINAPFPNLLLPGDSNLESEVVGFFCILRDSKSESSSLQALNRIYFGSDNAMHQSTTWKIHALLQSP